MKGRSVRVTDIVVILKHIVRSHLRSTCRRVQYFPTVRKCAVLATQVCYIFLHCAIILFSLLSTRKMPVQQPLSSQECAKITHWSRVRIYIQEKKTNGETYRKAAHIINTAREDSFGKTSLYSLGL